MTSPPGETIFSPPRFPDWNWASWLVVLGGSCLYTFGSSRWLPFADTPQAFLFYPASAIAIALVLILEWQGVIAVLLGSLAVNISRGVPGLAMPALVAIQVLEPLLVSLVLRRCNSANSNLATPRGLLLLFGTAVPVNLLLSALPGPAILQWKEPLGRFADPFQSRLNWFLGDQAGILCLTPFLLLVLQPPLRRWIRRPQPSTPFSPPLSPFPVWEALGLGLGTLLLVGATFNTSLLPLDWRWPLRFACFLPATWAALRLGIRGAAAMCAFLPLSATLFFWLSPWGLVSLQEFRALQLILILAAFMSMLVGATVEENRSLFMKFHNLVEESDHGILRVDPEGRILDCNRVVREWSGRSHASLNWTRLADLLAAGPDPDERVLLAAEGAPIPVRVHSSPLADGTAQVSILDLRQVKAEEATRKELDEHLHEGQKMEAVGTLAGGIAHEFNNLLTVILANCERIQSEAALPADSQQRLDTVVKAAQRAAHVTNQLMAYSLADRGAPCPLDPPVILEEALGLLRSTMDPRIQVRTEVVGSCLQVRMDPGHFRQIVLNLVFNARDAMPAGGVLTLRLTCLRLDDHLNHGFPKAKSGTFIVLSVQDSGIGMDPETQARAFDPFFTTKEVGKGAGLGLSSVLGLVKLYGGWIHLASQPGTGTTVRVYLPAIAQESLEASAESAEQPQPGFPGQRRILLVDDEVFIRDVAREILESKGFKVTEAADGEEALARFLETPLAFDLVVLDLVMPRMHGFQVMDRIRQVAPRIPILISSGYSPDTRPDLLQASPFIGFLAKPYRTRELLEQVQRLLSEQESEP